MAQTFQPGPPSRKASAASYFGWMLIPALIWSVYHLVGYLLVEFACQTHFIGGAWMGLSTITLMVLLLTLAALPATVYVGYRAWQKTRRAGEAHPDGDDGERLQGIVGSTFSLILALIILADGASIIVLGACG